MVTPELISYIRGEVGKGRTREDIKSELLGGGGWNDEDISEAFRIVMPMQGFFAPSAAPMAESKEATPIYTPNVKEPTKLNKKLLEFILVAVILLGGATLWYFYRPQLNNLLGSVSLPSFDFSKITSLFSSNKSPDTAPVVPAVPVPPVPLPPEPIVNKDCGVGLSPDLKDLKTYQNNAVLECLGERATSCLPAEAVLGDDFFPTMFQITGDGNNCSFKLSYSSESKVGDSAGHKLAGEYISCPISIVKRLDDSSKTPVFKIPNKDIPEIYASEIYFYGTLGVFMENNVNKSKILSLGCSGPYIDSVIDSYKKAQ